MPLTVCDCILCRVVVQSPNNDICCGLELMPLDEAKAEQPPHNEHNKCLPDSENTKRLD